ncbi:hypothetical protein AK812_SmicGene19514 [Symbiodinium microadriaticum]|uniref:Uncharacterized protein n=1 Tax=Symbiodinium microadriaticum TaxID=2951 RepID=A0A1Q9DSB3_SYMMI|nr:hypothetical protein AK812_SmicGene19514 [Symbiodinium microadriaticum]
MEITISNSGPKVHMTKPEIRNYLREARKLQAFYWSITELGHEVAMHAFLAFFQPAADFGTGVRMPLGASSKFVLVAKLGLVMADESALKQTYESKGASGKVPCLFLLKRYAPTGMDVVMVDSGSWDLPGHYAFPAGWKVNTYIKLPLIRRNSYGDYFKNGPSYKYPGAPRFLRALVFLVYRLKAIVTFEESGTEEAVLGVETIPDDVKMIYNSRTRRIESDGRPFDQAWAEPVPTLLRGDDFPAPART